MRANELRIGNWVYKHTDSIMRKVEIASIDINGIKCKVPETRQTLSIHLFKWDDIKPIPIELEDLKEFGFTKRPKGYSKELHDNNGMILVIAKAPYYEETKEFVPIYSMANDIPPLEQNIEWHDNPIPKWIKYIHQLQNLFFALTGEELTIK